MPDLIPIDHDPFAQAAGPSAPVATTAAGGAVPALPQLGLPGGAAQPAGGGITRVPGGGIVAMPYNNAEAPYLTDLAQDAVKFRREAITNAKEAQRTNAALTQFETAIAEAKKKGTSTGYFTPALGQLAAGAEALGIDLSAVGVPKPEAVSDLQSAQKVSKMIFGEVLRKMFPQRITNADIKVMEGIAPGLGLDERANENLTAAIRGQNGYDKDLATKMLDYEEKNRGLFGFERKHYAENGFGPLSFAYSRSQPSAAPAGQGGAAAAPQAATPAAPGTISNDDIIAEMKRRKLLP